MSSVVGARKVNGKRADFSGIILPAPSAITFAFPHHIARLCLCRQAELVESKVRQTEALATGMAATPDCPHVTDLWLLTLKYPTIQRQTSFAFCGKLRQAGPGVGITFVAHNNKPLFDKARRNHYWKQAIPPNPRLQVAKATLWELSMVRIPT